MQIKNAQYILTAVRPDQYPANQLPEVALVGRSNVGKSSFINALANRKDLARVAATPGKTRVINFYDLDRKLVLVDLPGYGYAKVSKQEKEAWAGMIETYLNTRRQLKLIVMLVDIRHDPSQDDQTMFQWLTGQTVPWFVIATKADKVPGSKVGQRVQAIREVLALEENEVLMPFSSVNKAGRNEIWGQIEAQLQHE